MTTQTMDLAALLGLDKYQIDETESHITIDQTRCEICQNKPCLTVCPAEVYSMVDGRIVARYENCLECGTCTIACETGGQGGIDWRPPQGGFGIVFRYG